MNEKETINRLIDARLTEYRIAGYNAVSGKFPPRIEILGIILAAWAEWDGIVLLEALSYALEDSKFHGESAVVDEMVNIINSNDTAQNYQLVKKPAMSANGLPGELFAKRQEETAFLDITERDMNAARRRVKAVEGEIASALSTLYNLKGGDGLHGTPAFQQWVNDNRDDLPGNWSGVFLFVDIADSPTTVRLRWDTGRRLPIDAVPLDIVQDMRRAYLEHRQQENARLSDERHVPTTDPARTILVQSRQTDEFPAAPPGEAAPPKSE